jgi:branched-subunit amino acid ABC-type transport system permease component
MILVESVLQALLTSLLVGGIYGLLCVGLGLIFNQIIDFIGRGS